MITFTNTNFIKNRYVPYNVAETNRRVSLMTSF